jgi:GYF domain 2
MSASRINLFNVLLLKKMSKRMMASWLDSPPLFPVRRPTMPAKWYFSRVGLHVAGPCSSTELKRLAASGRLSPDDLVGKNRKVRLVKAGTVNGLFIPPAK